MPTISFVSTEEHEALKREVAVLRALLEAHVINSPVWLRPQDAGQVAGMCRQTLAQRAQAMAPGVTQDGRTH